MNQIGRVTLLVLSLALALGGCRQATVPEDPTTPPVSPIPPDNTPAERVISGTLTGWNAGEAFVTFPGGGFGFSIISDGENTSVEDIDLRPPLFQGTVAADGSFSVTLRSPDPSELIPFECTEDGPNVAAAGIAVTSSVANPTQGEEIVGIYSYADTGSIERRAGWLYVAEPYEAEETCTPVEGQEGTTRIDLSLETGWNEVVSTATGLDSVLTSEPIPDTFVWIDELYSGQ